jgi:aldehyde dehydrogenase (NAD+)
LIYKLANLIERDAEELAAIEAMDTGKPFSVALDGDIDLLARTIRSYAAWADKNNG